MPSLQGEQPGKVRQCSTSRRRPMPSSVPEADFATRVREGG
jgi:hypothetical protein